MATLVGTPQASNSEGLAGLSTPISYSKATGLALQLANMLASAGQVVPYMRKLTPAQFTSGSYDGIKPDGYTPAAYKLSMLEMPETIAVYDDVLKVCQPVMVYQVGTPTQLITSDFPIQLQTGNFTIGGKAVPAVSEGQSVLLRFYKNANIKINWANSNIANNGLTDEVITTTTELAFIVTYVNGAYKVTEWISPNFITAQLNTLKTTKKNNFASIINELFNKIPAPVTLPDYDTATLKLANNLLSVILAPQATKAKMLNEAFTVVDFTDLTSEGIGLTTVGETRVFRWGGESYSPPPGYTDAAMPGFGIATRANAAEYYLLAMCRKSKVSGEFNLSIGVSQTDGGGIDWTQIGGGAQPQMAEVNGFGEIYDNNPWLKDQPKGSVVPFMTTRASGAQDMGPWGNFANSITGFIIVTTGPEGDDMRAAEICAFLDTSTVSVLDACQGCYAYAYMESSDAGATGGVARESDWFKVGDLPIAEFGIDSPISINGTIKVGDVLKMRLLIESENAANIYVSPLGTVEASVRINQVSANPSTAIVLGVIAIQQPNTSNQDIVQRSIKAYWSVNSSLGTTSLTIDGSEFEGYAYVSGDFIYLEQHSPVN